MAALGPSSVNELVGRLLHRKTNENRTAFDIVRPTFSALPTLVALDGSECQKSDDDWLARIELRRPSEVIRMIGSKALRDHPGSTFALFVDGRCGLIETRRIGKTDSLELGATAASFLKLATACHAEGYILITDDTTGKTVRSAAYQVLTTRVQRMAEAIDVHLLDHFVLLDGQWKRMRSLGQMRKA